MLVSILRLAIVFVACVPYSVTSLLLQIGASTLPDSRDYCLHESFNATCLPGTAILMTSAIYGRMRVGRCISGDFNIGCSKDVISYFDRHCSGRRSCDVMLRNLVDVHPCQRDFMSYLEASFRCVPATNVDQCPTRQRRIHVTVDQSINEAYLAYEPRLLTSALPSDTSSSMASLSIFDAVDQHTRDASLSGVGLDSISPHVVPDKNARLPSMALNDGEADNCPWIISARPGQRLVLKILVFTVTLPLNDEDDQQIDEDIIINDDEPLFPVDAVDDDDHVTCSTTVIVGDSSARKTHELALCVPGRSRVRHLYTSVGHQVSLYVANSDEVDDDDDVMQRHLAMGMTSSVRFMISYEAMGCPDLVSPSNAWLERSGDRVMIKCNDTLETWFLTCQNNRWIGDVTNCSSPKSFHRFLDSHSNDVMEEDEDDMDNPYSIHGVVLAVLLGVFLGIFIGMLLLLSLYCAKRKRSVAAKREGFNRAILMMSSCSNEQPSSTILDGRMMMSGTGRCGYRVTDASSATVSGYHPTPVIYGTASDDVMTCRNIRCLGHGNQQHPLLCRQHDLLRSGGGGGDESNRMLSIRLLSRDECDACLATANRTYHSTPAYHHSADEDAGCQMTRIASSASVDLVKKDASSSPSAIVHRYSPTDEPVPTSLEDSDQRTRCNLELGVCTLGGSYLLDRCGNGLPPPTSETSANNPIGQSCPSTTVVGVC